METCCQSIIKYLIFILNFVIAVAGLALIGVSAYVYIQSKDNSSISLIVLGIITFIISFLGCYGSLSENKCMIYTYATILFIISLIEIFIAVSIYDFIPGLPKIMRSDMDNYHEKNGTIFPWDFMQGSFSCCGVINYKDWNINSTAPVSNLNYEDWNVSSTSPDWNINSTPPDLNVTNYEDMGSGITPSSDLNDDEDWNIGSTSPGWNTNSIAPGSDLGIPASCCDKSPCTSINVHPDGCFEKLATFLTMGATTTIGIALLQMIIGICSCWIGHSSKMEEYSRHV